MTMIAKEWADPKVGVRRKKQILALVQEAHDKGWTERYLVNQLRHIMVLSERDRTAITNYRKQLLATGTPRAKVDRLVAARADKFKSFRAKSIAITERNKLITTDRDNELGPKQKKRWKALPGACPVCQAMHGTTTKKGKPYGHDVMGPPMHPNCRCTEEVIG